MMDITSAKYVNDYMGDELVQENYCINAIIDGITMSVPLDPNNRHYAAILKAVEEGTLTIQEATA